MVELAATINAATPFVKLTYNLEEMALLPWVVIKLLMPWMLLLDKLIILTWKLWLNDMEEELPNHVCR